MTEAEWLTSNTSASLLEFLFEGDAHQGPERHPLDRKLRLFACTCLRRIWHLLDESHRHGVEIGERCAEGLLGLPQAFAMGQEMNLFEYHDVIRGLEQQTGFTWSAYNNAFFASAMATGWLNPKQVKRIAEHVLAAVVCQTVPPPGEYDDPFEPLSMLGGVEESATQAGFLRDIFGDPFRPGPTLDPTCLHWHNGTIPRLAQQMYDSGDFISMPVLADALEEAGCTDATILDHCRGAGPHVRGCWVVDLVLGKV